MIDWALLLAALIAVESGGDTKAIGDGGKAVGILQIHPIMVEDCNRILTTFKKVRPSEFKFTLKDRLYESTSRNMAIVYLRHYGKAYTEETGESLSYEVLAKMWNGGPTGWKKSATEVYWQKVEAELNELRKGATK